MPRVGFIVMLLIIAWMSAAQAVPRIVVQTSSENKTDVFRIDLDVARIEQPSGSEKKVNESLARQAEQAVADFKGRALAAHPADRHTWELSLRCDPVLVTDRWLAFQINGREYTGGAHGNPFVRTALFDLRDGRQLALSDLFQPGSRYLEKLSSIAGERLATPENLMLTDKAWIARGTSPTATNFAAFYPDGQHLVLIFPPYQVGPYVAGMPTVKIPYAELKSIARPGGPVAQ